MMREEAIEILKTLKPNMRFDDTGWLYTEQALDMAIKALSQEPTSEMIHVETLHQVMWERDIAIGQLKELGYEFGQKIEPCDDAISRKKVEEMIKAEMPERGAWEIGGNKGDVEKQTVCEVCVDLLQSLNELPSITPKPTECDDAISREAVKEIIARNDSTNGTVAVFTGKQVISMVNSLPMVTPIFVERQTGCDKCAMNGSGSKYCDNCRHKSGHWIKGEEWCKTVGGFERWGNDYTCSECGLPLGRYTLTDFCPNCGARMESEDKE